MKHFHGWIERPPWRFMAAIGIQVLMGLFFVLPHSHAGNFDQITDRTWPANYGDAQLCLWKDDKLGAVSITMDDNNYLDHAWWIEQGEKYGYKFTWFVITGSVGNGPAGTGGWWGTWADFQVLHNHGHDLQSHTVSHLGGTYTLDEEYRLSKEAIEAHFPDIKCITLAYPGNASSPVQNDPEVAKTYYSGARGVVGVHNQANNIDYMNTNSFAAFSFNPADWYSLTNILTYNPSQPRSYRAWECKHFHGVSAIKDQVIQGLDYIKAHEDDLWVGLFREVILFGQERDTATVTVTSVVDNKIELNVTDSMDDGIFDYPLTIKVKLDNSWTQVAATQSGKPINAELVTHLGDTYALVQIVPDKGTAVLQKDSSLLYGDISGDNEVTAYDAALTAQASVGLITLTADQTKAADVSGDNEVTAYDAALIAQRAVGLIDKFPKES